MLDNVGRDLLSKLIYLLPYDARIMVINILNVIFAILYIVLSTIIVLHLFKIRYLDYYVVIEDKNVTKKTIEKPVIIPIFFILFILISPTPHLLIIFLF